MLEVGTSGSNSGGGERDFYFLCLSVLFELCDHVSIFLLLLFLNISNGDLGWDCGSFFWFLICTSLLFLTQ